MSAGATRTPEASRYRRNAGRITTREVLHASEKRSEIEAAPILKRKRVREELEARWAEQERLAATEAEGVLHTVRGSLDLLAKALERLAGLRHPELLGKVEEEQLRVRTARAHLDDAAAGIRERDFGAAGMAVEEAERELWLVGGELVLSVNQALSGAAVSKAHRAQLEANVAERRQAKIQAESHKGRSGPSALEATSHIRSLDAAGLLLAAEILANQVQRDPSELTQRAKVGRDGELRVIPPQECETFEDVGGLEEVKEQLRSTIGAILERPDEAARYRVVHNGILFHGPPGTGKNLLSRALAGEYGLRYLRFSPATIASAYIHEAAANLRRLFELAKENVPCVLFLDEIDTIASDRGDQPSADHREVVTQLMVCLEEYRTIPGLVVCAATNDLDRLDPALREGRFDAKILVPLPDPAARAQVLSVHLRRRGDAVAWDGIDLEELARTTGGYNAAALETVVSMASQSALRAGAAIGQPELEAAIRERGGRDRLSLDERLTWDDVVLADETREHLMEVLEVFSNPDAARELGVHPPAGLLLHGPPGTGKTTMVKAMASQVEASFYEQSAAELLSKWAGESEQRVAKLFVRARANRPSIIFIDEIDALLARRSADSSNRWEERVISQFLRELDGLRGGDGVLLVGATNRLDVIDEAVVGRRLTPIEVGLPDPIRRLQLLKLLCRGVKLGEDVDLRKLASQTEGLSGADLKRLCNTAGMKALRRTGRDGSAGTGRAVTLADFEASLDSLTDQSSMVEV